MLYNTFISCHHFKIALEHEVSKFWMYLFKRLTSVPAVVYILAVGHVTLTTLFKQYIDVNFSKLTDCNQVFRNNFLCIHYLISKISTQIIKCKNFAPDKLFKTLVIESSYGPKKKRFNYYLTWNFSEVVMIANKLNPENLLEFDGYPLTSRISPL